MMEVNNFGKILPALNNELNTLNFCFDGRNGKSFVFFIEGERRGQNGDDSR